VAICREQGTSKGEIVVASSQEKNGNEMADKQSLVLVDQIEPMILDIRDHKVLLDSDLARLYGVPTKQLNQQVRRNRERFPEDFLFQLNSEEASALRSQNVTASPKEARLRSQNVTAAKRNIRYRPFVFTEHGAIMAATVLNSACAVEVSVFVVRAFVKLRHLALGQKELAAKLAELERRLGEHDGAIRQLVAAIRQLMQPVPHKKLKERFGFAHGR
jgi:hypothetical protein